MTGLAWLGALAFSITLVTTRITRFVMVTHGVLDIPNFRSAHTVPTPRGGGLACAFGVAASAVVARVAGNDVPWAVVGGALFMAAVGFMDDRRNVPPLPRLAAQALAGAGVGWLVGGSYWSLLGLFFMPVAVNAVNFMDGIDGVTALTMMVWGTVAECAALTGSDRSLALLGVLVAAPAFGFLPWNARRGFIFLGDVGSYLFGALAAGGVLLGAKSGISPFLLGAPLSVYLVDVGLTLARRLLRRAPVLEAHREHVYQKLVHEFRFPHLLVALWVALVSLGVSLAWTARSLMTSLALTGAFLALYLLSPPLARLALSAGVARRWRPLVEGREEGP